MTHWVRFARGGAEGFGTLADGKIAVNQGDMFAGATATGETLALTDVTLLAPSRPTKMIALWNNYRELGQKLNVAPPDDPLYLLKAPNSFMGPGAVIRRPASYAGRIVYEGELGIVIGRRISNGTAAQAAAAIFGFTCINDVTASDLISKNPTFAQWVRAKSFDTFGVFGPAIATGLDPMQLRIRTTLNGEERQSYPVSDTYFPPAELVARLSADMTLEPGDVIACGTSVGVGVMKGPKDTIEVEIAGIGTLSNVYEG